MLETYSLPDRTTKATVAVGEVRTTALTRVPCTVTVASKSPATESKEGIDTPGRAMADHQLLFPASTVSFAAASSSNARRAADSGSAPSAHDRSGVPVRRK